MPTCWLWPWPSPAGARSHSEPSLCNPLLMAPIPARRPPPPWPHESFRVGAALAASVSDLEEGCQGRGDLQSALRKSSYRSTQSPLHVSVPLLATKTVFPGGPRIITTNFFFVS